MSGYALTVLNLGAGVQSTTMALMAAEGLIKPMPDFADTGWEPQGVYETLDWLHEILPFEVRKVSAEYNGQPASLKTDMIDGFNVTRSHRHMSIPLHLHHPDGRKGIGTRQCTSAYKVLPIQRAIRRELGVGYKKRVPKDTMVEQWLGISTDEAIRMRDSRVPWSQHRYPLIDMGFTRQDCLEWFRSRHPNRELTRSACVGCPFRTNKEWLDVREQDPQGFAEAVEIDRLIRSPDYDTMLATNPFLHYSMQPLDVAVEEASKQKDMNPSFPGFLNECDGLCGV